MPREIISNRSSVMVVDDAPENLWMLSGILENWGYQVTAVPDGKKALELAEASPPDIIILDIAMPDMDGYQVCSKLKESSRLHEIPVVFISALTDTGDIVNGFKKGGVDYITKPFQADEVKARIETHLRFQKQKVQLKESYKKLGELEKLRDNLIHMVVHDMRSQLTVTVGMLEYLSGDIRHKINDDEFENLDMALSAARDLTEMTNSLLDMSRMEASEMPLELESIDLRGIVCGAIKSLHMKHRPNKIIFEPCEEIKARCDSRLVYRVIVNLLQNAVKFTSETDSVRVRITQSESGIKVEVIDQGDGIPEEYKDMIFEKFGQIRNAGNCKRCSSGIGLAFCKLAVERHGGKIGVESSGQGSNFWFTIPVYDLSQEKLS
jgi:signal transduction histidine kinase